MTGPSNQDACQNVTISLGFAISERPRAVGRPNTRPPVSGGSAAS